MDSLTHFNLIRKFVWLEKISSCVHHNHKNTYYKYGGPHIKYLFVLLILWLPVMIERQWYADDDDL